MSDVTRAKHGRPVHHWRRNVIHLAALLTAVAVVDGVPHLIGKAPDGPALLLVGGAAGDRLRSAAATARPTRIS